MFMILYEMTFHDDIAVDLNNIITSAHGQCTIQDDSAAKALILMPHVLYGTRHLGTQFFDDCSCILT